MVILPKTLPFNEHFSPLCPHNSLEIEKTGGQKGHRGNGQELLQLLSLSVHCGFKSKSVVLWLQTATLSENGFASSPGMLFFVGNNEMK